MFNFADNLKKGSKMVDISKNLEVRRKVYKRMKNN